MSTPAQRKQYFDLVEKSLDGVATSGERAQLEQLLLQQEDLRHLHTEVMTLTVALGEASAKHELVGAAVVSQLRSDVELVTCAGGAQATAASRRGSSRRLFVLAATLLILASALGVTRRWLGRGQSSGREQVAINSRFKEFIAEPRLPGLPPIAEQPAGQYVQPAHDPLFSYFDPVRDAQVVFAGQPTAAARVERGARVADAFASGREQDELASLNSTSFAEPNSPVALEAGITRLIFRSGGVVILEGPAQAVVVDERTLRLDQGVASLRLTNRDNLFTVATPLGKVQMDAPAVAMSGVSVTEKQVRVDAFEGDLEVVPTDAKTLSMPLAVQAGDAIVWDRGAGRVKIAAASRQHLPWRFPAAAKPDQLARRVLLHDDFSEGQLDPARWLVVTRGITVQNGAGYPSIQPENGYLVLRNRAHLVTSQEFDPVKLGGIRITGRWTPVGVEDGGSTLSDFLQVLTRSDGRPNPQHYGDTTNGINAQAEFHRSQATPLKLETFGMQLRLADVHGEGELQLRRPNMTFQFEMIDAGDWVSFWVGELNDPTNFAYVRARVAFDSSEINRVVVHNREFYDTDHEARLHGLRIESYRDAAN